MIVKMAEILANPTPADFDLAKPDLVDNVKLDAWYMDNSDEDQRFPHRLEPNQPCSLETLKKLGVVYWKLDADTYETDPKLIAIRKVHQYNWTEIVNISPTTLPNYEAKLKSFYEEHIHADDEIRYILDGSGYFDVRDNEDRWIRIACFKGDMIVIPEGIYHRFSLDSDNYTKAMRLFQGEPIWTPHNRPQENHPSRVKYVERYISASA